MQFGVGLGGLNPPSRLVELAQLAEELGLDQVWVPDERFFRDPYVNMTVVACHTRRIRIGCMVTDPFVRHPALTAAAAASVDDVSDGRCVLGVGAGISGFHEMGMERVRPARAIKEAIELIRRLTGGEEGVNFEGELIAFRTGQLAFKPARPVPIYVAGRGPRVLQAGGEVADGVVVASYASERGIRWGLEQAAIGARRGGRSLDDLETLSWLYTSISSDPARARDAVRTGVAVAMWGSRVILDKIGVSLPEPMLRYMDTQPYSMTPDVISGLARLIPDELLDEFSLAGTAEAVAAKLIDIARLGIGHAALWLFPPEGERIEDLLRRLAEEVVPRVEAGLE